MHLLQVCNVGEIMGGTAACAWSLARALPEWSHTILFLSPVSPVTREAFAPHSIVEWSAESARWVKSLTPDQVVLHNIGPGRVILPTGIPTIQYVHSTGRRMAADQTLYCSEWLANQCDSSIDNVWWQGVPVPQQPQELRPRHRSQLRIGRICTPTRRKWPEALISFYTELARRHPTVQWEFVGCPLAMQPALQTACRQQAFFHPASWRARSLLWEWDALLYHHPTLTESFGRTLAEAARAGCLPIVDQRGGFVEQLRTLGGFGGQSMDDFSQSLEQLADASKRVALSDEVRQHADDDFSLRAFRNRFLSHLQGAGTGIRTR